MKIEVLGTEYTIIKNEKELECNGYCDITSKTILITPSLYEQKEGEGYLDNIDWLRKKTTRHELIHAMLNESGLYNNTNIQDEMIVDWIAIQYPKMQEIFSKLNIDK